MIKQGILFVLLLLTSGAWSQQLDTVIAPKKQSFFLSPDPHQVNKGRAIGTGVGIGTVWAGSVVGLSQMWYGKMGTTKFHVFDDSKQWLQMDKAGHAYAGNKIANLSHELLYWSGLSNNKAAYIGTGISMGYLLSIEIMDGFGEGWGFSWSDVTANGVGAGVFLAQQLIWKEQRFIAKYSYTNSGLTHFRPDVLGSTFGERLLKDYNGQTYWLSFSPVTFMKNGKYPRWLCFSLGYGANNMLSGNNELLASFKQERQFYFSLDIDFSRLPIKRPWLKAIVKQLNYIKIPFPAFEISGNKFSVSWFQF